MKYKILLFLILTLPIFSQGEGSLENAVKYFESHKGYETFDIRSAKQLWQADEIVTTIDYKGKKVSGYTARIEPGQEYLCRITLFEGFEYAVVAAGDDNSVDIDLFVYDSQGNTVAMDREVRAKSYATLTSDLASITSINNHQEVMYTEVSVRPLKTEKYWVKIKLRESLTSTNDVAFLVGNRKVAN